MEERLLENSNEASFTEQELSSGSNLWEEELSRFAYDEKDLSKPLDVPEHYLLALLMKTFPKLATTRGILFFIETFIKIAQFHG